MHFYEWFRTKFETNFRTRRNKSHWNSELTSSFHSKWKFDLQKSLGVWSNHLWNVFVNLVDHDEIRTEDSQLTVFESLQTNGTKLRLSQFLSHFSHSHGFALHLTSGYWNSHCTSLEPFLKAKKVLTENMARLPSFRHEGYVRYHLTWENFIRRFGSILVWRFLKWSWGELNNDSGLGTVSNIPKKGQRTTREDFILSTSICIPQIQPPVDSHSYVNDHDKTLSAWTAETPCTLHILHWWKRPWVIVHSDFEGPITRSTHTVIEGSIRCLRTDLMCSFGTWTNRGSFTRWMNAEAFLLNKYSRLFNHQLKCLRVGLMRAKLEEIFSFLFRLVPYVPSGKKRRWFVLLEDRGEVCWNDEGLIIPWEMRFGGWHLDDIISEGSCAPLWREISRP